MKIKKTKIIATIGPSSDGNQIIMQLIKNGMDVARINMAHMHSEKYFKSLVSKIRLESKKLNKNIAIMMDIAGPKIRVNFNDFDNKVLSVVKNKTYRLGYHKSNDIPINLNIIFNKKINTNSLVKIDDGKIIFKVLSIKNNNLVIKSQNSGLITANKGINFPNIGLNIPSITSKDKKDIELGIKYKIDLLSLSFVRSENDIKPINNILKKYSENIPVIAKIEKPEAIQNLNKIIEKFDGILIARGDLGVEESLAKVPVLQKQIIQKCTEAKKPVIVATQILESMIDNSSPTRAEVNDVANSVYDRVDAVMLSGETAIGKYPVEAVSIMSDIINDVEDTIESKIEQIDNVKNDNRIAIGHSVRLITKSMDIDGIVVMSESGATARIVSHYRPDVIIFGMSPHQKICNRMSLYWGVVPIQTKSFKSTDDMIKNSEKFLLKNKMLKKGQTYILTAGIPIGVSGSTNMIQIQKIK